MKPARLSQGSSRGHNMAVVPKMAAKPIPSSSEPLKAHFLGGVSFCSSSIWISFRYCWADSFFLRLTAVHGIRFGSCSLNRLLFQDFPECALRMADPRASHFCLFRFSRACEFTGIVAEAGRSVHENRASLRDEDEIIVALDGFASGSSCHGAARKSRFRIGIPAPGVWTFGAGQTVKAASWSRPWSEPVSEPVSRKSIVLGHPGCSRICGNCNASSNWPSCWFITPAKTPTPANRARPCEVPVNSTAGVSPLKTFDL